MYPWTTAKGTGLMNGRQRAGCVKSVLFVMVVEWEGAYLSRLGLPLALALFTSFPGMKFRLGLINGSRHRQCDVVDQGLPGRYDLV